MIDIPLQLVLGYALFSFFLFYQQLHLKHFQGASEAFGVVLGLYALAGMIYGLGFLVYWGYQVSVMEAVLLFVIAFVIKIVWFPLEVKLGLRGAFWVFSLAGFLVLPVSGYFMWASLP